MDTVFCYKCGSEIDDSSRFCDKCGEPVQAVEEHTDSAWISANLVKRPVLIAVIAGLAVILIGVYIFMAWVPPSLAKTTKAMQNLKSYEQEIRISIPYEDDVKINMKTDNRNKLTSIKSTIEGEKVELFLENSRLIIGLPDYEQYGEITLDDSQFNDKRTQTYLNDLMQDLEPVGKVLSKQIIKPNSDIKFYHAVVNTPGGDIKVKQYNLKMGQDQLAQTFIDTTTRLGSDQVFRKHITSAYNTTVDYMLDVSEDYLEEYDYEVLNDSRDEFDDSIQEMADSLDEDDEQSKLRDSFRQEDMLFELQMCFDYHNRLVELIINMEGDDEKLSFASTCYNFNKPLEINLPDSSDIEELGSFEELFNSFY